MSSCQRAIFLCPREVEFGVRERVMGMMDTGPNQNKPSRKRWVTECPTPDYGNDRMTSDFVHR